MKRDRADAGRKSGFTADQRFEVPGAEILSSDPQRALYERLLLEALKPYDDYVLAKLRVAVERRYRF